MRALVERDLVCVCVSVSHAEIFSDDTLIDGVFPFLFFFGRKIERERDSDYNGLVAICLSVGLLMR